MLEIPVEMLRGEIIRLRAVVANTRVFHPSGIKLHSPAAALGPAESKAMHEMGMKTVYLLEPGEGEAAAQKILTTELIKSGSLQLGDLIEEDVKAVNGAVLCRKGTAVDPDLLRNGLPGIQHVTIRKRGLAGSIDQAKGYLARIPQAPSRPPRPDSRVTTASQPGENIVRPLMFPQARIFVAVKDDFQRMLIANLLASHGHDVVGNTAAVGSAGDLHQSRPDLLLLDLDAASAMIPIFRKSDIFRNMVILVTAPEGRKQDVYKALTMGANGSVPVPPRREPLLEKVRGTLAAFGRSSKVPPVVQTDRRAEKRDPGNFACTLVDKFLKTPLAVTQATVLDIGEGGLRIEYSLPGWPSLHAYMSHGVHPQHGFFNYARDNPLGRDLTVTLPPAAGRSMEIQAKFVHVALNGVFEQAGLVFHRVKGSVRDHMTTFRGIRPSSVLRSPQTRPF